METAKTVSKPAKKRVKIDWDAVERDYRTGKFTLRELEAKHGADNGLIARNAKKNGWTQDLSIAIKQATNAKLVEELVSKEVSISQQQVSNTVLAAADVNVRVIMGHRHDLANTRNVAASLLAELANAAMLAEHMDTLAAIVAGEDAEPVDMAKARAAVSKALTINNRIASVKQLADTFDKLQIAERRAFAIEDGSTDPAASGKQKRVLLEFVDVEPR